MKDIIIEDLENANNFKKEFGFKHSYFAIGMSIFFFIIGILIWAMYFWGKLLSKGDATIVLSFIFGLCLFIYLVENTIYKMKFNKYFNYFKKTDKKMVPCYLVREDVQKMGAMLIDTYYIPKDLSHIDDEKYTSLISSYKSKKFGMFNNPYSSGIVEISKINIQNEGYEIPVMLINTSDLRDNSNDRVLMIEKMIYTEKYLFFSKNRKYFIKKKNEIYSNNR